jgi:putative ABC transport system permease protein
MDAFWQDLRYAARSLAKSPLFTVTVFLSLTVGFGAAVAMFAIVNAFFVRPLPFPEAGQLVSIDERHPVRGRMAVAPANLKDMSARLTTIESLGAFQFADVNVGGPSTPIRVLALKCATDVFATLQVRAALGRTFHASDFEAGHDAVAVIADGLWREQFGRDPRIIGRTLRLDGVPRTVIGVMAPDFHFMGRTQAWVPSVLTPGQWTIRQFHSFTVVGRLPPGMSLTQARAELGTLAGQLSTAYPATNKDWTFSVAPLRDVIVGRRCGLERPRSWGRPSSCCSWRARMWRI